VRRAPVAVALLLALAGCGGAEPAPAGPPTDELRVGMQEYAFQLSARSLVPGPVTVVVTNAGSAAHDVVLEQDDVEIGRSDVLSPGERQTLAVQVDAGSPVHLTCTLTGHAEAGMHAAVDVVAAE
jgi:plastocyanin